MQLKVPASEIETIELVPLHEGGLGAMTTEPRASVRSWLARHKSFLFTVVLPTGLAAIYFGLVAVDRFEAESRFVVRGPSAAAASQITSLVQGTGIVRSSDDAYIVHAYMRSRDALRKLVAEVDLLTLLGRPEADFWWRYPGPGFAHNEERLWRHFKRLLSIEYDQTTGISTLKVQAFRPDDARAIADALLADAEALINRLGERSQGDAMRLARREVDLSRERARVALNRVTEFRRENAIIDPGRVSTSALDTITSLALDIAQTNAKLAELKQGSPDSPQASALRLRIAAFEEQIRKERAALAGTDSSLAPLIAKYERLVLEREFAERAFASAQSAFDIARIDAERQKLFLERISTPVSADYPEDPQRLLMTLAVFVFSLMLYSIGRRVLSDTLSHAER